MSPPATPDGAAAPAAAAAAGIAAEPSADRDFPPVTAIGMTSLALIVIGALNAGSALCFLLLPNKEQEDHLHAMLAQQT